MNIRYTVRSKFISPCKKAIVAQRKALDDGQTISVNSAPGGYSGDVKVTIASAVSHKFQAERNGKNITRFPARIKAAATALRDCGDTGEFRISHDNGLLSITNLASVSSQCHDASLAALSSDPEVQREIRQIQAEFAACESDGLDAEL